MADAATEFFDDLGRRGHEPLLEKATGIVGFDLVDGKTTDRWLVATNKGDIAVSHKGGDADLTLTMDSELFDHLARGEANLVTAVLRGEVAINGAWQMMVLVRRLFPGSPSAPAKGRAS